MFEEYNETSLSDVIRKVMKSYLNEKEKPYGGGNKIASLITKAIPEILEANVNMNENIKINGACGIGKWASIPQITFLNKNISTSPQRGYYVGYLFSENMDKVYLTLSVGASDLTDRFGSRQAREILYYISNEMKELIEVKLGKTSRVLTGNKPILGNTQRAKSYQKGTIGYIEYSFEDLDDNLLYEDLEFMLNLYEQLSTAINQIADNFDNIGSKLKTDRIINQYSMVCLYDSFDKNTIIYMNKVFEQLSNENTVKPDVDCVWTVSRSDVDNFKIIENFMRLPLLRISKAFNRGNINIQYDISKVLNIKAKYFKPLADNRQILKKISMNHTNQMDASRAELMVENNASILEYYADELGQINRTNLLNNMSMGIASSNNMNIVVHSINKLHDSDKKKVLFTLPQHVVYTPKSLNDIKSLIYDVKIDLITKRMLEFVLTKLPSFFELLAAKIMHSITTELIILSVYKDPIIIGDNILVELMDDYGNKTILMTRIINLENNDIRIIFYNNDDEVYRIEYHAETSGVFDKENRSLHIFDDQSSIEWHIAKISVIIVKDIQLNYSDEILYEQPKNKLLYFWVKKYNVLENVEINLSNTNRYHFDGRKLTQLNVDTEIPFSLSMNNPHYSPRQMDKDFLKFENESIQIMWENNNTVRKNIHESFNVNKKLIQNINTMIGKNGSGKTTFTKLILEFCSDSTNLNQTEFIMVYKSDDRIMCDYLLDCDNFELLSKENTEDIYFESVNEKKNRFPNALILQYHNSFDIAKDKNVWKGNIIDLSDYGMIIDPSILRKKQNDTLAIEYSQNTKLDCIRILKFILDYQDIIEYLRLENVEKKDNEKYDDLNRLDYYNYNLLLPYISLPYEIKIIEDDVERTIEVYNVMESIKFEADGLNRCNQMFEELNGVFDILINSLDEDNEISFDIELIGLSAGEYSRLKLFSRIHWMSILEDLAKYAPLKPFVQIEVQPLVYIILDEAESHFHPEWLRSYIYDLIFVITNSFSDHNVIEEINLIIATNSPFIMADVSKEHTICLKKEDGKIKVFNDFDQTFGQDIHTITESSFFIDDIFGVYADYKVKDIIQWLEHLKKLKKINPIRNLNEGLSVGQKDLLYSSINRIGEDIIRETLQREFALLLDTRDEKEDKIAMYLREIEELRRID